MKQFLLLASLLPLLPLTACKDDGLTRLLNGDSAAATKQQPMRQYYGAQGTITTSEANVVSGLITPGSQPDATGMYRFAQTQSRKAVTSRLGFENSYQGNSSYYGLSNGGETEIVYDDAGDAIGVRQRIESAQP